MSATVSFCRTAFLTLVLAIWLYLVNLVPGNPAERFVQIIQCGYLLFICIANNEVGEERILWLQHVSVMSSVACVSYAAVNGNVECARILLQTSQNDDRNAVNCVDELERFWTVRYYVT